MERINTLLTHIDPDNKNSGSRPGFSGPQDLGGVPRGQQEIDKQTHQYAFWERQLDSLCEIVFAKKLINVHSFRRAIESLDPKVYETTSYYEKWAFSFAVNAIEQKLISNEELQEKLNDIQQVNIAPKFEVGEEVQVREEDQGSNWRKPHIRTPGYIFGQKGVIERYCGAFGNPELEAFGLTGPPQPLYRVRFQQKDVWKGYEDQYEGDTIDVEIYQHWLQQPDQKMPDQHMERDELERFRQENESPPTAYQILSEVLVELMIDKGLITSEQIRKNIEEVDMVINNIDLAKSVVSKAWTDSAFKDRLLSDPNATLRDLLGYDLHSTIAILENTSSFHNFVVCTLCSCYPREILGIPPDWYKSSSYRARAVKEPRAVLREFGLKLGDHVTVRVNDSTADLRYFVLPVRPSGTEGWTEEELKKLITRDCLIGIAHARSPRDLGK